MKLTLLILLTASVGWGQTTKPCMRALKIDDGPVKYYPCDESNDWQGPRPMPKSWLNDDGWGQSGIGWVWNGPDPQACPKYQHWEESHVSEDNGMAIVYSSGCADNVHTLTESEWQALQRELTVKDELLRELFERVEKLESK